MERLTAAMTGNESYSQDSGCYTKKKLLTKMFQRWNTYISKANESGKSKAKYAFKQESGNYHNCVLRLVQVTSKSVLFLAAADRDRFGDTAKQLVQ